MQKVIFFTAGEQITVGEQADIDALNTLAEAPYDIQVRRADIPPEFGANRFEATDFVAGTIPDIAFYESKPVFDPDNPPAPELPATEGIVANGDAIVAADVAGKTASGTIAVADNVVGEVTLPGTNAILTDGDTLTAADGGSIAIAIAAGVITATYTAP